MTRKEIAAALETMTMGAKRWGLTWLPSQGSSGRGPVVLLLCLIFLAVLLRTAWFNDDARITLRTVLNVTHGYGLTFNVAERVQTYTHPLWMLMLTGAYLVAGNVYYAMFGLSVGVSLFAFWLTVRQTVTSTQVWIVAAVLLFSHAFVDYSTSGLENPLSNLLLVAFVALVIRSGEGPVTSPLRLTGLWTVASLLYLTRPDNVLLVAPALVWLTARAGNWKVAARQTLTGLLPAAAWTAFSLIYYGFPFPNTAYAKFGTGFDRGALVQRGWFYLLDSIDRDPVTLITILFGVTIGLLSRGPARWIAWGVLIDLTYVVSIGGDFMSGRFLAVPLFVSVLILSRAVSFEPAKALTVASLLAVVGWTSTPSINRGDFNHIEDERASSSPTHSLVLATSQSFPQPEWAFSARQPVPTRVVETCTGLGGQGLVDPMTHLLDWCALADPLLARLPAIVQPEWRAGHFSRMIPEGYRESLEQDANLLSDIAIRPLYDDLRLITRAPRLLSRARLAAIWRVNTGAALRQIDRRFYRFAGSGFDPVVHVRWVQYLGDTQRTALERLLGLYQAEHRAGSTFRYQAEVSQEQFETIVSHDMVVDTYGFDLAADAKFGPLINVRWVETLGNVRRTALEQALGLYRAEHTEGNTWRYRVPDASPERLRAIAAHDMIADTNGFDRGSLELDASEGDVARLAAQPPVYSSGWHPPEFDAAAPESTWKWTQQTATLSFGNPNTDAAFYLDYAARPDLMTGAPQTVTVRAGDQVLESFVANTAGRRLRRILLPNTALGTGDRVEIQIAVDRTFVSTTGPAGEPAGRDLGIQVFHPFVVLR